MSRKPTDIILSAVFLLIIILQSCTSEKQSPEDPSVAKAIRELDIALDRRTMYIDARQQSIDSIKSLPELNSDFGLLMAAGDSYCQFSNDSAIAFYNLAEEVAPDAETRLLAELKALSLLPLAGIFEDAAKKYEAIDTTGLSPEMMMAYHEYGRRMYSYTASAYAGRYSYHGLYQNKALEAQRHLIAMLPADSDEHIFNIGEYYFLTGKYARAKAMLSNLLDRDSSGSYRARAHHHLAEIADIEGYRNACLYHLAKSAIADTESATLEVIALQQLGNALKNDGDVERAYRYLYVALDNAVRCGASLRMIESSRSLPIIAQAHNNQINSWRNVIYMIIGIMMILLVILAATLVLLYRKMVYLNRLRERLHNANLSKDVYINQFLKLCSIYMDKLHNFCHIAERKISAGKTDEFYRMTKSGRFIEEQSAEFYEVFDDAFLHLYPDFVEEVNNLLRPECRIVLKEGEQLNTDLRILAISRMGIDDSASIAQILNYSLNTIYSYRNRLKARAINRDTFEEDIMKIASAR